MGATPSRKPSSLSAVSQSSHHTPDMAPGPAGQAPWPAVHPRGLLRRTERGAREGLSVCSHEKPLEMAAV